MEKIRFLNDRNVYEGEVSVRGNVAAITFAGTLPSRETLAKGFELLNENNGLVQGDYTSYTTVRRTFEDNENRIELSCDGSVYTPPAAVIPTEPAEPEPYVPTYGEVLYQKIRELSLACQSAIEDGLTVNGLHYSYTERDQLNLNDIFHAVKLTGLPLGYHADGHVCTERSAGELAGLYLQLARNKYCQQAYFNLSREYLTSLEESDASREIIEAYVYGTPLTGEYLAAYDSMAALYDAQVQAMAAMDTDDAETLSLTGGGMKWQDQS